MTKSHKKFVIIDVVNGKNSSHPSTEELKHQKSSKLSKNLMVEALKPMKTKASNSRIKFSLILNT